MKAITLIRATNSYKLGQVKITKSDGGVYITAKKIRYPITCSDIITAANALGMMVYYTPEAFVSGKRTPAIFIGDQYEQKNPKP